MASWRATTIRDALFGLLTPSEKARPFSLDHPALRDHLVGAIDRADEWQRIGILQDVPAATPAREAVFAAHPAVPVSDARLRMRVRPVVRLGQPDYDMYCPCCGRLSASFTLADVRGLPEEAEKPILKREVAPGQWRVSHNIADVAGYQTVDLKRGAGFVCDGCWTGWIRMGWRIDGQVHTKLRHAQMLGAPQSFLDEAGARPGWGTPGLGS